MADKWPIALAETDVGLVREKNEDNHRVDRIADGWLLVVCDGMGGHLGGQMASEIAVNVIWERIVQGLRSPDANPMQLLWDAIVDANNRVYAEAQANAELRNMGTTVVIVLVRHGKAYVAHVGDSRVYLMRNGELSQVTRDHAKVQMMLEQGILSPEEAENHPDKNVILKAVGHKPELEPEVQGSPIPVQKGDTFLLCSDGLTDVVSDPEIEEALFLEPELVVTELIDLAKERGAPDNVTVAIFQQSQPRRSRGGLSPALRKVGLAFAATLILGAVAFGAYYLGQQSGDSADGADRPKVASATKTDDSGSKEQSLPGLRPAEDVKTAAEKALPVEEERVVIPPKPAQDQGLLNRMAQVEPKKPDVLVEPEVGAQAEDVVGESMMVLELLIPGSVEQCARTDFQDDDVFVNTREFLKHLLDARRLRTRAGEGEQAAVRLREATRALLRARDRFRELTPQDEQLAAFLDCCKANLREQRKLVWEFHQKDGGVWRKHWSCSSLGALRTSYTSVSVNLNIEAESTGFGVLSDNKVLERVKFCGGYNVARGRVKKLIEQGEGALAEDKYEEALDYLNKALDARSGYTLSSETKKIDDLKAATTEKQRQAEERRKARDQAIDALKSARESAQKLFDKKKYEAVIEKLEPAIQAANSAGLGPEYLKRSKELMNKAKTALEDSKPDDTAPPAAPSEPDVSSQSASVPEPDVKPQPAASPEPDVKPQPAPTSSDADVTQL
jgi:serine/threonine protein phosphatase PrpC/tetratricopeptide (TPR) repeat protein